MMRKDANTLYAFKFHDEACISGSKESGFGVLEGYTVGEVLKRNKQGNVTLDRQIVNVFKGTQALQSKARDLSGVSNLDDLSSEDRSFYMNLAISSSNVNLVGDDDQIIDIGGFNLMFNNDPDKPRTLDNESLLDFSMRVVGHEGAHAVMRGGINVGQLEFGEKYPYEIEQAIINQRSKLK
jgi:hypothetical protein